MAEMQEKEKEKTFIRETIQEKPKKQRPLWKWVLLAALLAVIFGVIAGITFVLSGNWFRGVLGTTEETRESVTIPTDTEQTETPTETTTEPETSSEDETKEEAMRETLEGMVEEMVKEQMAREESRTEAQLPGCVTRVGEIASQLKSSLVTVTTSQEEEDVFSHTFTRSEDAFGVILAITGEDVRIATEAELLENAEAVRITFQDGTSAAAELVASDATTHLAVVSVRLDQLDEELKKALLPVTLGNSYLCHAGDMVVALGSPLDYVPSVAWGIVSYVKRDIQGTDRNIDVIQTDIAASDGAGGILVNSAGELVGWITSYYNEADQKNLIAGISISDIKDLAERVANGSALAKLGVQIQTVTEEIAEAEGLPQGLYVIRSMDEGPAYEAGIQDGDILTGIGGEALVRSDDLKNALLQMKPGDEVEVQLLRNGRDGYKEQTFTVTLGSR